MIKRNYTKFAYLFYIFMLIYDIFNFWVVVSCVKILHTYIIVLKIQNGGDYHFKSYKKVHAGKWPELQKRVYSADDDSPARLRLSFWQTAP